MATATLPRPAPAVPEVSRETWMAVFAAVLGAFMAVLDIQITNSSVKDITGAIGATVDEGSWISTAYLVAEIIIIPLSGWLTQVFSLRSYMLATTSLFLVFSLCCGLSWNLSSMIGFRALQGFTGGALIPLSFQVILTKLPASKRSVGLAMFAFTATFAPAIGPTIGGYLTDNFGWETIFYMNLVPGAVMLWASMRGLPREPKHLELIKTADWWGIGTMAVGLSSLTVFLEEGQREDWFGSSMIRNLCAVSIVSLAAFFYIELKQAKNPFINLRLVKQRNFGLGSWVNITMGVSLYGSLYLVPLWLAQIQGYNSVQIGETVMWSGLPQLFLLPFVPRLMAKFDARALVALGAVLFAISCYMNSHMTIDTGMDQLRLSQFVRAMGQPLIMVPLSAIATGKISGKEAGSASGLFNMMRNMGGSVGIAMLSTMLTRREQLHSNRLGEAVSLYSPITRERLNLITQKFLGDGFDPVTAGQKALGLVDASVRRQAMVIAFNDCFLIVAGLLLVSAVAILFTERVAGHGAEGAH